VVAAVRGLAGQLAVGHGFVAELRDATSARLRPIAFTRRRTSPVPGSGRGSSSSWRTSGPPVLWNRTILTVDGVAFGMITPRCRRGWRRCSGVQSMMPMRIIRKSWLFAVIVVGLLPARAAQGPPAFPPPNRSIGTGMSECTGVPVPRTTLLDNFDGSCAGEAFGVLYVQLPGAQPGRRGALFSRKAHSRIEYARGIPGEGTLEWWITVEANQDRALIFTTDSTKLLVSTNGDVSFSGALESKGTAFRFDSWHAIGVSYGSQGAAIMVDGTVVASAPARTQAAGILTVGGFDGTVALFRASSAQQDWYLARGVTPDFRRPRLSSGDQSAVPGKPGVFRPGNGVSAPLVIYKIEPEYSEEARNADFQGTVVLQVIIDESGHPTEYKILRPLDLGLDEKAIEAVRQWRFRPGLKDGEPVAVVVNVEVNFRLGEHR